MESYKRPITASNRKARREQLLALLEAQVPLKDLMWRASRYRCDRRGIWDDDYPRKALKKLMRLRPVILPVISILLGKGIFSC